VLLGGLVVGERYRFFVEGIGPHVGLADDQAHHARAVLRLKEGDEVIVFDGCGKWAEAVIETTGKHHAGVRVTGEIHEEAEPGRKLTLATALPKGDRAEWLIEQASQLGATCVQWLDCERGVVKPKEGTGKIEKWRRWAVESAKQCGRAWMMRVEPMRELEEVLAQALGRGAKVIWLEPREGRGILEAMEGAKDIVALIGPEGGWSPREMELLMAAAERGEVVRVRLGANVLRIETACAAVAGVMCYGL